mmetsp:Transcript_45048/g.113469  ORF Transcript_45048/g.113469 Transcript_45048/m.113469 type:complete len:278 (-) Transcript_45048:1118-1951(-)
MHATTTTSLVFLWPLLVAASMRARQNKPSRPVGLPAARPVRAEHLPRHWADVAVLGAAEVHHHSVGVLCKHACPKPLSASHACAVFRDAHRIGANFYDLLLDLKVLSLGEVLHHLVVAHVEGRVLEHTLEEGGQQAHGDIGRQQFERLGDADLLVVHMQQVEGGLQHDRVALRRLQVHLQQAEVHTAPGLHGWVVVFIAVALRHGVVAQLVCVDVERLLVLSDATEENSTLVMETIKRKTGQHLFWVVVLGFFQKTQQLFPRGAKQARLTACLESLR